MAGSECDGLVQACQVLSFHGACLEPLEFGFLATTVLHSMEQSPPSVTGLSCSMRPPLPLCLLGLMSPSPNSSLTLKSTPGPGTPVSLSSPINCNILGEFFMRSKGYFCSRQIATTPDRISAHLRRPFVAALRLFLPFCGVGGSRVVLACPSSLLSPLPYPTYTL